MLPKNQRKPRVCSVPLTEGSVAFPEAGGEEGSRMVTQGPEGELETDPGTVPAKLPTFLFQLAWLSPSLNTPPPPNPMGNLDH